ncbi:MAG: hypothetical protein QMC40_03245, partial [Vicingaceae bacterium]
MKNFKLSRKIMMGAAFACALSVSLTSCEEDEDIITPIPGEFVPSTPQRLIGLDISANTTWSKDTIYILTSRIKVRPGATLTINSGTIIKGSE